MTQENPTQNAKTAGKPRIVRVVSDGMLEAWEEQRAGYLKEHPGDAIKPIKDPLVREALGMPEETEEPKKEEREKAAEEEKAEQTSAESNEEDAAEKAQAEDEEKKDEADAEAEEEEEKETEEEEEEKESEEEEARVEVEKPAESTEPAKPETEKKKPKIVTITAANAAAAKQPNQPEKPGRPRLIEKFEEQAARDILPNAPQPRTPITLGEASTEVRVEEARRIWLQREAEKKKKLGFFGKIKATLGFR